VRRILSAALGLLLLCGTAAAFAQTAAPERAGRLSYVEGSVSVQSAGADGWAPAGINLPVTTGTALWTEPGARAEIQVGAAGVRIDSETELNVTRLDDQAFEIAVAQGAVNLHRPTTSDGPIWVDTPNGPVTLTEPGFYRVTGKGVERAEVAPTEFDRWAMAREAQESRALAETLRHVSPQTTGYQDLAAYGNWTVTPQYGAVWYPRTVPVGWVPYRYGRWTYVFPWGWTWVDDAPWGFAPFHYGSWILVHGRWGWCPGPRHVRPVYVPARVVILHGGHDRHAPPARWIPLAPHERHARVTVNVQVDVNRFANRHAVSSASPRMVARALRHREAPAPRGGWQGNDRRDHDRRDEDRHDQRRAATVAPAPKATAPVVRTEMPRPEPRRVDNPRDDRRPGVEGRRTERERASTRQAVTPQTATAAPPRSSERPQPPVTWRRDPARIDARRAPEARVAPPTPAPEVQPRLGAPARAPREAVHEQDERARAETVAPRQMVVPQAQAAPPQVVRPQPTPQAQRPQPAPHVRREGSRDPPQMRPQTRPARVRAAPAPAAPQVQTPARRAPQAAPAAQHERGGRHERRDDGRRKG
jgi:hypothetical protein